MLQEIEFPNELAVWVAIAFLAATAALIAYGLYKRTIIRYGILRGEDGSLSTTRMLTLAATIYVSGWYLTQVYDCAPGAESCAMPDFEPEHLYIFLGANGTYLAAKSLFLGTLNNPLRKLKDIFL